jgi:hypothetical protein
MLIKTKEVTQSRNMLQESYDRSPNLHAFLTENGNTQDNAMYFSERALTEAMTTAGGSFMFENGMKVPSLGSKASGRLSLNAIYEYAPSAMEFSRIVDENICARLGFSMTETDAKHLREHYNKHCRIINNKENGI